MPSQVETEEVDVDLQKEYTRQREYLERNLAALKKKVVKDQEVHQAAYVRIMQVTSFFLMLREVRMKQLHRIDFSHHTAIIC